MKKTIVMLLILISIGSLFTKEMYVVNANSQTLGKIDLIEFTSNNAFAQIGLYANHVIYEDNRLFVVNSGDNSIQVINPENGTTLSNIILENSSNPWNIVIHENNAYVSGLYSDKIYKIDINTYNIEASLNVGAGPEGMIIVNNRLFVALTGFQYPTYLPGKVAVIDTESFTVINSVDVATNPQALISDENNYIHVVCTGNYSDIMGKVVIFNSETYEIIQEISFNGYPTTIQSSPDNLIYLGDGFGSGFFTYNKESYEVINDAGNSIFPGGSHLLYDNEKYYVLCPGDWVGASKLKIFNLNKEEIQEINLGIGASSMVIIHTPNNSFNDTIKPEKLSFTAYPNPFKGQVSFKLQNENNLSVSLDIFNLKGQRIKTIKGQNPVWDATDKNNKEVPAGIYFVRINDGSNQFNIQKIVKIK